MAASALATVVAAVLASGLGVYGTIIGAAVVSICATTGGAIFQHLFRRTGEQFRSVVDRTAPTITPSSTPTTGGTGQAAPPTSTPSGTPSP